MNSPNPSSLKSRFTRGLLKSLVKINKQQPRSSFSEREILQRYRRIKTASYASLASAVGTRRAWSRALLRKIRNRGRTGVGLWRIGSADHHSMKKKKKKMNRVSELRKIVPGGEGMDTWSLLEETADYVKCLSTQVKVMRAIVEIYSTSTAAAASTTA